MIPLKYNVRNLRVRWVNTTDDGPGHGPGRLVVVHPLRPGRRPPAQPEGLGRPARPDRAPQGVDERDLQRVRARRRPTTSPPSAGSRATSRGSRWSPRSCSTSRSPSGSTAAGRTSSSGGSPPPRPSSGPTFTILPGGATSSPARASASSAGTCRGASRGPRSAGRSSSARARTTPTASSACSPPAAATPRARSGSTSRTSNAPSPAKGASRASSSARRRPTTSRRSRRRSRTRPSSGSCAVPEAEYFAEQSHVERLPQGRGHADRRPPDLRGDVRRGQHDVRRRERPDPRDRHDAGARLHAVRHPDLVPRRVDPALRPRRGCSACSRRSR